MNQLRGLLRDTWWLWLLMFAACIGMAIFLTWIYWLFMPALLGSMIYFAMMRYDRDGRNIGDSGDHFNK